LYLYVCIYATETYKRKKARQREKNEREEQMFRNRNVFTLKYTSQGVNESLALHYFDRIKKSKLKKT